MSNTNRLATPKAKKSDNGPDTSEWTAAQVQAEAERQHAARYPNGCPNLCEACVVRLAKKVTPATRATRLVENVREDAMAIACALQNHPVVFATAFANDTTCASEFRQLIMDLFSLTEVILDEAGIEAGKSTL